MRRTMLLLGLAPLLLLSCAGGARPIAVFEAEGGPPQEKLRVELAAGRDGTTVARLYARELDGAVIVGKASEVDGAWRLRFERLEWFNNWTNGWTQAAFLLDGSATLRREAAGWAMAVDAAPKLDAVESASIRYFGTYLRGEEGRSEFAHRWDRIRAVVSDLSSRLPDPSRLDEERYLRRYLFPELYGYDRKPDPDHGRARAQGVEWNVDYTREHFAEPLRALRDSGTLLRDYKESPGLWLLDIAWSGFWARSARPLSAQKD